MTHAYVTVFVPFLAGREKRVEALLDDLGLDEVARQRLPRFVHFLSMVVLPENGGPSAYLVLEVCADGPPAEVLPRLVDAMGATLRSVIQETGNDAPATDADLVADLEERRVDVGTSLFATPGLVFTGTPGMSVRRIRDEWRLAQRLREILESKDCPSGGSALKVLKYARSQIFRDADLKWAFVSEPVPLLAPMKPALNRYSSLAFAALRDYFWVLIPLPLLVWGYSMYWGSRIDIALWHLVVALLCELALVGAACGAGYLILRRQEENDVPYDAEPGRQHITDITARENRPGVAQNHLAGISILKPGFTRHASLRLALWLIAELTRSHSRPGFLDRIGTIHFARWILLPGTDRLVFLSNYDGSWQSYLEDFIARLREGLTSVWSNTRDFPKTAHLFVGGASDSARFKRWARRQQVPTRFWYSAYPQLTTSRIRANAAIRHGFASASSESHAAEWLALFGYVPPESVEKDEVCALVFGGLPFFGFAHCLIVQFGEKEKARAWLRSIQHRLSYGEHAILEAQALVAAFTAGGLRKLNLDETALATFPTAFQEGMPARARALGDEKTNNWQWGDGGGPGVDAALIVYAKDDKNLGVQIEERKGELKEHGHRVLREVPLQELHKNEITGKLEIREPFGFRDGISQPIMRGSKDWSKPEKEMHVIEPGELVLGYRDNLGNIAPSPCSKGEDIGRNGTFLVIRQLEQNVKKFDDFVAGAAQKLEGDARVQGLSGEELRHWVAATMVGRWRDGSSLLRYPHPPAPKPAPARVPDNDFRFGREDPHGLRCPLGAHIRRANPRDSFEPGSALQLAISNRHRILRVGRVYEPDKGRDPGLLFMCINADIERQFEFLQQTWIFGSNFHGLDDEIDPIVGYRGPNDAMTVPTARGPVRLQGLEKFVTVLGGGYFFIPGRSATRVLAG